MTCIYKKRLHTLKCNQQDSPAEGMNNALQSGALDMVGIARLMAIDPAAPAALLAGKDSAQRVSPIKTGIKLVDRLGLMEVLWYGLQVKRIARGGNPKPSKVTKPVTSAGSTGCQDGAGNTVWLSSCPSSPFRPY